MGGLCERHLWSFLRFQHDLVREFPPTPPRLLGRLFWTCPCLFLSSVSGHKPMYDAPPSAFQAV